MPMAKAKGTPRIAAPTPMPTASTKATIIVARTKAESWSQAMTAEESTRSRAVRGKSRTTQDQMRGPS